MKRTHSLPHTVWIVLFIMAAVILFTAILHCPGQAAPLGLLAGATIADGHPDQLVGVTWNLSPRGGLFLLGDLTPDSQSANARGILHLPLSSKFSGHLLLGPEVNFDHGQADTANVITYLHVSTGLALSWTPNDDLSVWAALDYRTPTQARKSLRFGLGIVSWLGGP